MRTYHKVVLELCQMITSYKGALRVFDVIYQTRETVFRWDIQTPRIDLRLCAVEYV